MLKKSQLKIALFALGLSMSSAAFAQADGADGADAPPEATGATTDRAGTTEPEIIVSGETEEERREYARVFLDTVGIGRLNKQTARWEDKICPAIFSLDDEFDQQTAGRVLSRVRNIARRTGVGVAGFGCEPNLTIAFVDDGPRFVASVKRKSWRHFDEIPRHKRDFVLESDAPVRWWYDTEVKGTGGKPLGSNQPMQITSECQPGDPCGVFQVPTNEDTKFNNQFGNSRIRTSVERHIRTATVVVDLSQTHGMATSPLADYVALVALAEIWPDDDHGLDKSILSLFDNPIDEENLPKLTQSDQGFLCALYRMPLARSGRRQLARMTTLLTDAETACDAEVEE